MKKINLGFKAFLPLILFLGLYIGSGLFFMSKGVENPFKQFPRHVAILFGIVLAMLLAPKTKISEKVDIFCESMGNSGVMMIILIYLLAGGFQGAAAVMGGKASIVNFSLKYIPVSFLVPGVFLICCLVSTAIGTSMGTIAAMAPVAIGVAGGANLNLAIIGAAVIGGSYFGDNLSFISDTTISAAQGLGAKMSDKFKMNFFIALPAAILAMVVYFIVGGHSSGHIDVGSYSILQLSPYFIILILALIGVPVVTVMTLGIISTGLIGISQGTVSFLEWVQAIGNGMSDMFSISLMAILISGLIGLVKYYGGIDTLVNYIASTIRGRKGAEYGIGLMSGILSAAIINNTIGIIVTCPIAKEIGKTYKIAPKRLASLVDIFACAFLALMPHDGGMLIVSELANVSPLEVLKHSYYIFFLILSTCLSIQLGMFEGKK